MKKLKELFEVRKLALKNGSLMSTLSGSGSSFFNLVYANDAEELAKKLKNKFQNFKVEVLEFDNLGYYFIKS